jgi:hypothetical protein
VKITNPTLAFWWACFLVHGLTALCFLGITGLIFWMLIAATN